MLGCALTTRTRATESRRSCSGGKDACFHMWRRGGKKKREKEDCSGRWIVKQQAHRGRSFRRELVPFHLAPSDHMLACTSFPVRIKGYGCGGCMSPVVHTRQTHCRPMPAYAGCIVHLDPMLQVHGTRDLSQRRLRWQKGGHLVVGGNAAGLPRRDVSLGGTNARACTCAKYLPVSGEPL